MSARMMGIDVYQLTTLCAHAREGRLGHRLAMSFFFRRLPRQRNFVVFCGLRAILEQCAEMRFDGADLTALRAHPLLGPAFARDPGVLEALAAIDGFEGDIDALAEGTLAFAGAARCRDGSAFLVEGAPVIAYTPLLQARTDLVRAKLIETPWLSRINAMSMVASKAARVVIAAAGRPVMELGQRRTHPDAAVDASYAAYVGGCSHTSNLAAYLRFGIPATGTMDHFAVQASERPGAAPADTERAFFTAFWRAFPQQATLLVDTYDTWRGVRAAVAATDGKLTGVRLDSEVTPESVRRMRGLLDQLGASGAKLFVSDGLDEHRVRALAEAGADGFGVGENITCSPDAATGVGAVGKLVENGYGKVTMKWSRGSGKATLPGWLQCYRLADRDVLALADEPAPPGGRPLLQPVWRGRRAVTPLPDPTAARAHVERQVASLPQHLRDLEVAQAHPWSIEVSDGLAELVRRCVAEAMAGGAHEEGP